MDSLWTGTWWVHLLRIRHLYGIWESLKNLLLYLLIPNPFPRSDGVLQGLWFVCMILNEFKNILERFNLSHELSNQVWPLSMLRKRQSMYSVTWCSSCSSIVWRWRTCCFRKASNSIISANNKLWSKCSPIVLCLASHSTKFSYDCHCHRYFELFLLYHF